MSNYQVAGSGVRLLSGNLDTWIPPDPGNRQWRKYQEWLAQGNTPDPEPVVPKPPPADLVEDSIKSNPALIALVRRTAKAEGITERALLDEIRAEAQEV